MGKQSTQMYIPWAQNITILFNFSHNSHIFEKKNVIQKYCVTKNVFIKWLLCFFILLLPLFTVLSLLALWGFFTFIYFSIVTTLISYYALATNTFFFIFVTVTSNFYFPIVTSTFFVFLLLQIYIFFIFLLLLVLLFFIVLVWIIVFIFIYYLLFFLLFCCCCTIDYRCLYFFCCL